MFIRNNYHSSIDCQHFSHSSIEMGIQLHCSLDFPIILFNKYRHPNTNTPFSFFSALFSAAAAYKYSLILGDLNAHHQAWGNPRIDGQGEVILRASDANNLLFLNDGSNTLISSSGSSSSIIDLSISSSALAPTSSSFILSDL